MLDPVTRHDFMATVVTAAAADGMSVVLSSHVLAELERVADYLILLSRGQVQIAGEVDGLLAAHRLLTGRPPTGMPDGRWCMLAEPRPRPACWSGQVQPTRSRPAGRRTQWAWKNSPWPTCASPAPRRCPARRAAGAPNQRR